MFKYKPVHTDVTLVLLRYGGFLFATQTEVNYIFLTNKLQELRPVDILANSEKQIDLLAKSIFSQNTWKKRYL